MIANMLAAFARIISGVNARWVGEPLMDEQRIYFANHSSHMDALVLWAALPENLRKNTRPVAGSDYWTKNRMKMYFAKIFNAVLIDRTNVSLHGNNPMDTLLKALNDGFSLIIFPEGTRGNGLEIGEFKSGLYYIAKKRPDIPLIPVYLKNLNRILPKGEFLPVPLISNAVFGSPVRIREKEIKSEFLVRAKAALSAMEWGLS